MSIRQSVIVTALVAVFLLPACSQDENPIEKVKEGVLAENLTLRVGKALADYGDCVKGTQHWTERVLAGGDRAVEFTCRLESAQDGWTEGRLATASILARENPQEIVTLLSSAGGMKVADRDLIDRYNAELDAWTALPREEQREKATALVEAAKRRIAQLRDRPEEGLYLRNVFLNTLVNRIEALFAVSDDMTGYLVMRFAPETGSGEKVTLTGAFLRAQWPERQGEFALDPRFVLPRIEENVPIVNNASLYPLAEKLQPNRGHQKSIFVDREN